jgi:outer membrane protein
MRFATGSCLTLCLAWAQAQPPVMGIALVDAVQTTLDRHPLLHFQEKQVDISKALKQQATGQFDTILGASANQNRVNTPLDSVTRLQAAEQGVFTDNQAGNLTSWSFTGQKLLRSGISIGPSVNLDRDTDNLLMRLGENRSQVAFTVTLPLLRNRGRDVVAAREISADHEVNASFFDLSQTAAELIQDTATAYWNFVGASRALEVAVGAEKRAREVVEAVRTLIDADRLARSEILDWAANLVDRTSSRIAAEQRMLESKQALALAMGISYEQLNMPLAATDVFPDGETQLTPSTSPEAIKYYIEQALTRRGDYLASKERQLSAQVLVGAARNQLLPQLDVRFGTGYSGLKEGTRPDRFFNSVWTRVKGVDVVAGITYSFPVENNVAIGQLAQASASHQQTELRSSQGARLIASSVIVAVNALENSVSRLKSAHGAVVSFRDALEGQREKLSLGVGSPIDVLTIEDRLTGALLTEVTAQLNFALALTQFRFATGTFIAPNQPKQTVTRDVLFTAPFTDWRLNQNP